MGKAGPLLVLLLLASSAWAGPWKAVDAGGARRIYRAGEGATWKNLSELVHLDLSEISGWAMPVKGGNLFPEPLVGEDYSVPNTIFFCLGRNLVDELQDRPVEQRLRQWADSMVPYEKIFASKGFKVVTDRHDLENLVGQPDTWGVVFQGCSADDHNAALFGAIDIMDAIKPNLSVEAQSRILPAELKLDHRLAYFHNGACNGAYSEPDQANWTSIVSSTGEYVAYAGQTPDDVLGPTLTNGATGDPKDRGAWYFPGQSPSTKAGARLGGAHEALAVPREGHRTALLGFEEFVPSQTPNVTADVGQPVPDASGFAWWKALGVAALVFVFVVIRKRKVLQ